MLFSSAALTAGGVWALGNGVAEVGGETAGAAAPGAGAAPCGGVVAQEDNSTAIDRPHSSRNAKLCPGSLLLVTLKFLIQKFMVFMLNTADNMTMVIPPTATPSRRISVGCRALTSRAIWSRTWVSKFF